MLTWKGLGLLLLNWFLGLLLYRALTFLDEGVVGPMVLNRCNSVYGITFFHISDNGFVSCAREQSYGWNVR